MSTSTQERGRITARVTLRAEETLKEAARLSGLPLNHFLVQAGLEKAERIIERERVIRYTRADAEFLNQLLTTPTEPNEAMKAAFGRFKESANNDLLGLQVAKTP
jgi:uncharacterized protein (DUF1778 family)